MTLAGKALAWYRREIDARVLDRPKKFPKNGNQTDEYVKQFCKLNHLKQEKRK